MWNQISTYSWPGTIWKETRTLPPMDRFHARLSEITWVLMPDVLRFVCRYGDRTPRSFLAKCLAIAWMLTGCVIFPLLTGCLITGLTVRSVENKAKLYGMEVGWRTVQQEFNLSFVYGNPLPLIEGLSGVALNFTDFDGWRLNFRAFDGWGYQGEISCMS